MARVIKINNKSPRILIRQVGARGEQGLQGEPGYGIPGGGLADQILQKASDVDFDYAWRNANDIADKTFVQDFVTTDTVDVEHNLNKYPAVTVLDSTGAQVEGEVVYASLTELIVSFAAPFSGRVACN